MNCCLSVLKILLFEVSFSLIYYFIYIFLTKILKDYPSLYWMQNVFKTKVNMRKFYSKHFNSPVFITWNKPQYLLFRFTFSKFHYWSASSQLFFSSDCAATYSQHLSCRSHLFMVHMLTHRGFTARGAGGCDSELKGFSGAAACHGHGQWQGLLLWFCLMTHSTNFSHPCSVFLLQPLHHPRVAVLTQPFVGPRCGVTSGGNCPTWAILPSPPR